MKTGYIAAGEYVEDNAKLRLPINSIPSFLGVKIQSFIRYFQKPKFWEKAKIGIETRKSRIADFPRCDVGCEQLVDCTTLFEKCKNVDIKHHTEQNDDDNWFHPGC